MATVSPQPPRMPAGNPKAIRIFSLIFKIIAVFPILFGAGFLAGAWSSASGRYNILKHWPPVDAVSTQCQMSQHQEKISESHGNYHMTTVYDAHIEVRYDAAGRQYTTPIEISRYASQYASIAQMADNFAPGTHHAIRYNPSNPNDIRYDVTADATFFVLPIILGAVGLVALVVGAGLYRIGRAIGRAKVRCPSCGEMVAASEGNCPLCGAQLAATLAPGAATSGP